MATPPREGWGFGINGIRNFYEDLCLYSMTCRTIVAIVYCVYGELDLRRKEQKTKAEEAYQMRL